MKNEIIDFERKGNLIRLYLGKNGKQWGDDWDDVPYEHNAGRVYKEFVNRICDIVVDFNYDVEEPADMFSNTGNSPYSKKDMIERKTYAFAITKEYVTKAQIYFGDTLASVLELPFVYLNMY